MGKIKKKINKYSFVEIVCLFILFVLIANLARALMGEDFAPLMKWWGALFVTGIVFYPLSACIFSRFQDKGYLFAKGIGIAASGWLMWLTSSLHILRFTERNCWIILIICGLLNYGGLAAVRIIGKKRDIRFLSKEKSGGCFLVPRWDRVLFLELFLFAAFVFFMYMKGFNPKAYGTEKMMDYGFMTSMYRTDFFPVNDFWFTGETLNYYYFGQYLMTYLTKLSLNEVAYGYNLALGMGFAFCLCFVYVLVCQIFITSGEGRRSRVAAHVGGALAGIAVTVAGNAHYIVFAKIVPAVWDILRIPGDKPSYWFPNSTRYIGYIPDRADKTIHEFPSYSFILGDLHAHVINITFVLIVLALLFAFLMGRRNRMCRAARSGMAEIFSWKKEIFNPQILMIGFFIGIFMMTNYWDFPIYFVVSGAVILVSNAVISGYRKEAILLTGVHAAEVIVISQLVALPFNLNFVKMTNGIALAENHTLFYQLVILWGLPVCVVIGFIVSLIAGAYRRRNAAAAGLQMAGYDGQDLGGKHQKDESKCQTGRTEDQRGEGKWCDGKPDDQGGESKCQAEKSIHQSVKDKHREKESGQKNTGEKGLPDQGKEARKNPFYDFLKNLRIEELYILLLGLCAIGLILVPEVLYIVDIYGGSYKRSNTMFKLSYQAFILFGISMGYIITRFTVLKETGKQLKGGILAAVLLLWTCGYFGTSCLAWFGDIREKDNYQGIRADRYIYAEQPTDAAAIEWLAENASDGEVILEANGDSYTIYNRVSVLTGLPTVLGWHTHEWLWHNSLAPVDKRAADVTEIYTSHDEGTVLSLLQQYGVTYLFVGSCEYEKYASMGMDVEFLKTLGEVVYQGYPDANNQVVYIIRISQ